MLTTQRIARSKHLAAIAYDTIKAYASADNRNVADLKLGLATAVLSTIVHRSLEKESLSSISEKIGIKEDLGDRIVSFSTIAAMNLGFWAMHAHQGWQASSIASFGFSMINAFLVGRMIASKGKE